MVQKTVYTVVLVIAILALIIGFVVATRAFAQEPQQLTLGKPVKGDRTDWFVETGSGRLCLSVTFPDFLGVKVKVMTADREVIASSPNDSWWDETMTILTMCFRSNPNDYVFIDVYASTAYTIVAWQPNAGCIPNKPHPGHVWDTEPIP